LHAQNVFCLHAAAVPSLNWLQSRVRPLLGIGEPMHAAVLAWVHFRQYVITQAPQLLSETRGLLYKLASIAADSADKGAG
jgi:hypothetical protein